LLQQDIYNKTLVQK